MAVKSTDTRDYRPTLNITLRDSDAGAFPQRGRLPELEPQIQKRWADLDVYGKSLQKPAAFVLHDGPPYSNGDIHLGHALNKIAKDIVTRVKTMQGYRCPYVPGWDNHGMPIENAVTRTLREQKSAADRMQVRRACREYAERWVDVQRTQFKRLGVRGDWDNPYLTMSREFEAGIVDVFGELVENGSVYRGLRPVLWCAVCETALADAEVEYAPHVSESIFVRFPLLQDPNAIFPSDRAAAPDDPPSYAVVWTTTPWTIPANLALAAHPEAEYAVVRATVRGEPALYLVAVALLESTMRAIGATDQKTLRTIPGAALQGLVFRHPLFSRASPMVMATYVTTDDGTGIVHTAPGHGKEDFETGSAYGLAVLCPVDAAGRFTEEAGEAFGTSFSGLRIVVPGRSAGEASPADAGVIAALEASRHLLARARYEHSYPHCWRCHSPLIFRATVQWFMNVDHEGHRRKCLDAIDGVTWYPPESANRIKAMVAGRPDWCISRQRAWGVGIPAFYCGGCNKEVLARDSIAAVAALVRREGSDAWYERPAAEILPPGYRCPHCDADVSGFRKETDVLDVWFDSGSTNRIVLEDTQTWPDLTWPCDVYLEGGDQHRGWFNSSLMIAVATRGRAPYRSVITNGWTLDESGHAMHKSRGNVVNPLDVVAKSGADVLRWWVASSNFMEDVSCGEHVLKQVGETYRRIRNTFRFLINNLYDFDPEADAVPEHAMDDLDLWALSQLDRVVTAASQAFDAYEFHRIYHVAHNFCAVELSAFYFDVLKSDRLYIAPAASQARRSAQTALHTIATTLARLLAPILVHTAEEVWGYLRVPDRAESVHLAALPAPRKDPLTPAQSWDRIITARDLVLQEIEQERQAGRLKSSLEARVSLTLDAEDMQRMGDLEPELPAVFQVSQVSVRAGSAADLPQVLVSRARGVRCARCWMVKEDVGADSAYTDLCGRCASIVRDMDAAIA